MVDTGHNHEPVRPQPQGRPPPTPALAHIHHSSPQHTPHPAKAACARTPPAGCRRTGQACHRSAGAVCARAPTGRMPLSRPGVRHPCRCGLNPHPRPSPAPAEPARRAPTPPARPLLRAPPQLTQGPDPPGHPAPPPAARSLPSRAGAGRVKGGPEGHRRSRRAAPLTRPAEARHSSRKRAAPRSPSNPPEGHSPRAPSPALTSPHPPPSSPPEATSTPKAARISLSMASGRYSTVSAVKRRRLRTSGHWRIWLKRSMSSRWASRVPW